MSSRDHHLELLTQLDAWLDHIDYHKIEDDIPDREEDVIHDNRDIFIKNVPEEFEKQFAVVCQAFPELKNTDTKLVFKEIPMTMQARPDIWKLLVGRKSYLILINTSRKNNGIVLQDVPFNGQLGVIAHECCHLLDYEHKNIWEIIITGVKYLLPGKRESYEKATDYLVVKKGFGLQLHTWANYVMDEAPVSEKYKETKSKYYLSPSIIEKAKELIEEVL